MRLNKLFLFLVAFAAPCFSFTLSDAEKKPILQAVDEAFSASTDYKTSLKLRALRQELQQNIEVGIAGLNKMIQEASPLLDSTGVFKKDADTAKVKAFWKTRAAWGEQEIPLKTKLPITVEVTEEEYNRVIKKDYDLVLHDVVIFKVKE